MSSYNISIDYKSVAANIEVQLYKNDIVVFSATQDTSGVWINYTKQFSDGLNYTDVFLIKFRLSTGIGPVSVRNLNLSYNTIKLATNNFNWSTASGDAGTYYWNFNSSDGYGGLAQENITVNVTSAEQASFTKTMMIWWD